MEEIWLPVKGYEGFYEVSNFGNVRSLNYNHTGQRKVLSQGEDKGYLKVVLCKNGKTKNFSVHRLVAEAFLPNLLDEQEVNHIDENKQNNQVSNLEWCDRKYNINYGNRNQRVAEKNTNGKCSKPLLQFSKTGELIKEWSSTMEAARNGFNQGAVAACCRGEKKSYKGYIWRYK